MICISSNSYLSILCLILFIFNSGCNKDVVDNPVTKPGWELTFSDEFSGTKLNTLVWKTSLPWGQSAVSENQHLFIDSAFYLEKGVLRIEAKRQTVEGMVYDGVTPVLKKFDYTSGLISTSDAFAQQYGYFEIRCKVPTGKGFWPALWLLPYDIWPPEIDILEIKGSEPDRLHMANHFRDLQFEHRQKTTTINGPNFSKDFHIFAIEWNVKEITWYLDNEKVFRSDTGIPKERMWLILSLGVGGNFSGFADSTTPSPSYFEIDYARVYQKK